MKRLLLFFSFLTVAFGVYADDGGVYNVEDWTYGNIYVKEPNDKIALEKELMVCGMDSITAVFVFKNTTDDTVTVDCAFPVDVNLPYTCEKDIGFLYECYSLRVLKMLLGTKDTSDLMEVVGNDEYRVGSLTDRYPLVLDKRVGELLKKHDKELRIMSFDHYNLYMDSVLTGENSRFSPNCHIIQDGKSVGVLNVGIESAVSFNEVAMRFHFHHRLSFLPNAYSKVIVKYAVESLIHDYNGSYGYYYDISTGGTWKGTIRSFMAVVKNFDMTSVSKDNSNRRFDYLCCDELEHSGIYYKRNYKPEKGDYFRFFQNYRVGYDHDCFPNPIYKPLESIQLKDVRSSSWINASAVMDRNQFTSSAIVDWENATLEFVLPQDGWGPFIFNGTNGGSDTEADLVAFQQLGKPENGFYLTIHGEEETDEPFYSSIYNMNWVKKVKFEALENRKGKISYSYDVDKENMRVFPYLYSWTRINNCVSGANYFPAGRYRLTIEDCYPGLICQDTTYIAEFWFLPIPSDMKDMVVEDGQSRFPIFQHVFECLNSPYDYFYTYESNVNSNNLIVNGNEGTNERQMSDSLPLSESDSLAEYEKGESQFRTFFVCGVVILLLGIGGFVWLIRKKK